MRADAEWPAARALCKARTSSSSSRTVVEIRRAIHSPYMRLMPKRNQSARRLLATGPGPFAAVHAITIFRLNILVTREPPDLSVRGKQEPTADLSWRCDARGLDQARVARHLSRRFRVH